MSHLSGRLRGLLDRCGEFVYIFLKCIEREMTMSESSRRKLLKSIAAGSSAVVAGKALPERWSKPVVDAVLLPAHAETTDETGSQPTTTVAPTTTPCTPCLVAADYCAGEGMSSIQISVSVDGTVSITHNNGSDTASVDPCAGGEFSFQFASSGGGTISVRGTIACGEPANPLVYYYTDGQVTDERREAFFCET